MSLFVDIQAKNDRGIGMRKTVCVLLCLITAVFVYAGDVANFVDVGFSPDGSKFVFGQHGITDGDFRAYADIYCIDVPTNRYIPGGVFSKEPSAATAGKDGSAVFSTLRESIAEYLKKLAVDGSIPGRPLYVQAREEPRPETLEFRDFETGRLYTVTMHSRTEGSGASVKSSFYLVVKIVHPDGKTDHHTVGLPGYRRKGIREYRIRRVVSDTSGNAVVFVVEKIAYSRTGDSIRYMVETLKL